MGIEVETGGQGEFEYDLDREEPRLDLVELDDMLAELEEVTKWLLGARKHERAGRPMSRLDFTRRLTATAVAVAFKRAGVELTKGHDGRFARALSIVLDAADLYPPEDLFPLVRGVVDRVRDRQVPSEKPGGQTSQ
jgi:hypothetical protein